MMAAIDASPPPVPPAILGVNGAGHESGNALACDGRVLPWLQDDDAADVWDRWGVAYRDVVVLDADNRVTAVYNLSAHDLAVQANFDELKALILAAGPP